MSVANEGVSYVTDHQALVGTETEILDGGEKELLLRLSNYLRLDVGTELQPADEGTLKPMQVSCERTS